MMFGRCFLSSANAFSGPSNAMADEAIKAFCKNCLRFSNVEANPYSLERVRNAL